MQDPGIFCAEMLAHVHATLRPDRPTSTVGDDDDISEKTLPKKTNFHSVVLLDDRQIATILAAVRTRQAHARLHDCEQMHQIEEIASNAGRLKPLSDDEMDALCELINAPGTSPRSTPYLFKRFTLLQPGRRVAYRDGFDGTYDGTVVAVRDGSRRIRVEWADSPPSWHDREDLVARGDGWL